MLSDDDLERYSRQVVLEQIGEAGQEKLKASKVALCGLGGLGCPAATYLSLCGIGELVLIDHDLVESSNLPRQPLYEEADIGRPKAIVAAEKLGYLNPHCHHVAMSQRMDAEIAQGAAKDCTLWIDATDNYHARAQIAELALLAKRPVLTASVQGMQGHITTLPTDPARGSFYDVYPHKPNQATVSQCEQVGILGAVAGVLGAMLAQEAVKEILLIGEGLSGKLLLYDGLYGRVQMVQFLHSTEKHAL